MVDSGKTSPNNLAGVPGIGTYSAFTRCVERLWTVERDAEKHIPSLGRFQELNLVGVGGFGVVYHAFDPKLERFVALKLPLLSSLFDPSWSRRVAAEASAAAALDHPNIVAVHEAGEVDEVPFIASAFVEGPNLQGWLADPTHEASGLAVDWTLQLALAVQHAHDRGILHRDIKPANVLLDNLDGVLVPKLTDFGLARPLDSDSRRSQTLEGTVIGTPAYIAPEQAAGRVKEIGVRSDVYSLGALLFELLTKRPPFQGENSSQVLEQVLNRPVTDIRSLNSRVPRDLEAICLKCLAKQPSERYESAAELAADLERFQQGRPTKARPLSRSVRLYRWARRHPALTGLAAALVVLAGLFVQAVVTYEQNLRDLLKRETAQRTTAEARSEELANLVYAGDVREAAELLRRGRQATALQLLTRHLPAEGQKDRRELTWRLLHAAIMNRPLVFLPGNDQKIIALASDEANTVLAALYHDKRPRWFDLETGQVHELLTPADNPVQHLLASSLCRVCCATDQGELVTACLGPKLDIRRGWQPPSLPKGARHDTWRWMPSGRGLLTVLDYRTVALYDLEAKAERFVQPLPDSMRMREIGELTLINTNEDWAILSAQEGLPPAFYHRLHVWNLRTGSYHGELQGLPKSWVHFASVSRSGEKLWVLVEGGDVLEFDIERLAVKRHWPALVNNFLPHTVVPPHERACAFGDSWVVLGSQGAVYRVYPAQGRREILAGLGSLAVSIEKADHDQVLVWNENEILHLRVSDGVELCRRSIPSELAQRKGQDLLLQGAYLARQDRIAFGGADSRIALLDLNPAPRSEFLVHSKFAGVWGVSFSPDGKYLATGGDDAQVNVWDVQSRTKVHSCRGHSALVTATAFSPDGQRLATASYDGKVRLWSMATGQCERVLNGSGERLLCVAWSPCGTAIAAGAKRDNSRTGQCGRLMIWDVAQGTTFVDREEHFDHVRSVAFHADGIRLYSAGEDRRIMEWQWRSGTVKRQWLDIAEVWQLQLDRESLVSVGDSRQISQWNLATGQLTRRWSDPQTKLRSTAWSSDGRTIVTGGEQGPIRFWCAASGLELGSLDAGKSQVLSVALSPDGKHLAAACHDGKVYLWTTDLVDRAARSAPAR